VAASQRTPSSRYWPQDAKSAAGMGRRWRYGSAMFTDLASSDEASIIATVGKIKLVLPAKAFKFGNVPGFLEKNQHLINLSSFTPL
jgi:hypothetical protein